MKEDNNSPKYLVKILNSGWETVTDADLLEDVKGDIVYDKENNLFIWLIETTEVSFQTLICMLITEFENPYLVITPNLEIIMDFKLDVTQYEKLVPHSKNRTIEQVKELHQIITNKNT